MLGRRPPLPQTGAVFQMATYCKYNRRNIPQVTGGGVCMRRGADDLHSGSAGEIREASDLFSWSLVRDTHAN